MLVCFIQPPDSVPPCNGVCTPHWALLMAGKGSTIYSSFNSSSKDTTSQLLWQIKHSDRSMIEVDNSPTNTSRVSKSVDSFSEFMAKQAVSAPLVLWSGKMFNVFNVLLSNHLSEQLLPLDSCYMCEMWYSKYP